ncbi:MAG: GNAT family N-acetyltransferase [Acetobacteraceae bacterium]|nr:GNAT family N-acetyltransferase [Acetobacteraceae bacterium]
MPDGDGLTLTLHGAIAEIAPADWDACAGEGNPFVSHAFLSAVEDSGSTGPGSGWAPRHAVLRDASGRVVACAPGYLKAHSWGEYVFDQGWARALEGAGGRYYPKWQICVPFSPVPGPRLLLRPGAGVSPTAFAAVLAEATERIGVSSCHVTFCTEAEWGAFGNAGWLQREGMQFHWRNAGYADFEAFLAALSSRKRKQIRRERREAAASGLAFRTVLGSEAPPALWAAFHRFYLATVDKRWGAAYLTPRFWPLLGQRLGDRVVLMLAERDGEPVAGALNLRGADALYGRNWGAVVEAPFLHFELCYYRAIEYAIAHGIPRVEAGAQGEHKIARGYLPVATFSAHWLRHAGLRRAVAEFLRREREALAAERDALAGLSPFRAEDAPSGATSRGAAKVG